MERRMTRWGGSDSSAHVSSLPRTKTFNTLQDTADPPSKPRLLSSNDGPTQLIPFMDKNPWQDHEQVASIVQAKKVYVSSCMQPKIKLGRLVAIRKIDQCPKEALKALQTARDENIVKCDQAYFWDESLYLVYELLPNAVTLSQVIVNPRGRLHGPEMATICLGLLKGIKYIHESLRMVHGDITKHTVLLSWHGQVKIANLTEKMLCVGTQPRRDDLAGMAGILTEMMHESPDRGQDSVVEFKNQCCDNDQTATMLLTHRFLQQARAPATLTEYVFVADILAIPSSVAIFGKARDGNASHDK